MTPGVTSGSGSTARSVAAGWEGFPGLGSRSSGWGRDLGAPPSCATPDARKFPEGAGGGRRTHTHSKTCSEVQIFMVPVARRVSLSVPGQRGTQVRRPRPVPAGRPRSAHAPSGLALGRPEVPSRGLSEPSLAPPRGAVRPRLLGAAQSSPAPGARRNQVPPS